MTYIIVRNSVHGELRVMEAPEIKAARLAEAKAKLKQTGKTPRQIGRDRIYEAVAWVYKWGWTSPLIIDAMTGAQRRGFCAKLVRAGLLKETRTKSGGIVEDVPSKIITLSDEGIALSEKQLERDEDFLHYVRDPYRVNQEHLRHDLLAQRATLKNLMAGKIIGFSTPAQMAQKSQKNIKQFDALWHQKDGSFVGVEVELSAKYDRRLDQFVWSIVQSLMPRNGKPPAVRRVLIVSDADAILNRYQLALEPGKSVGIWVRDAQSHWKLQRNERVPEEIRGMVLCKRID